MHEARRLLASAFAAVLVSGGPVCAQEWIVDAGAGARVRPAHLGSGQYMVDPVPILEASNGDVSISFDDGAKWRALRVGQVTLGPIAEYRQSYNDKLPPGAFHMNDAVELGGFAEWRTPVGIAEARLRRAVNAYQGWSGDLSFVTGAPVTSRLVVGGNARLSWADSNFTQEYFGLRPHDASHFGLPRFLDEDFITAGAELDAAQQITPKARLVLELTADRILGELRPSPVFDNRNIFTAALGLTYRWAGPTTGPLP
jgi:outer membrane scaffolding protein for murein synthesis (MipA/OmpV family)